MSERKQTPDVLADILSGPVSAPDPISSAAGRPDHRPSRRTSRCTCESRQIRSRRLRSPRNQRPAPTSWAYETVSFQDAHGWRPRFINGRELRDWMSGPLLHDYVNQRGAEGWELAAAAAGQSMHGTSDRYQIFFRKPKQGG